MYLIPSGIKQHKRSLTKKDGTTTTKTEVPTTANVTLVTLVWLLMALHMPTFTPSNIRYWSQGKDIALDTDIHDALVAKDSTWAGYTQAKVQAELKRICFTKTNNESQVVDEFFPTCLHHVDLPATLSISSFMYRESGETAFTMLYSVVPITLSVLAVVQLLLATAAFGEFSIAHIFLNIFAVIGSTLAAMVMAHAIPLAVTATTDSGYIGFVSDDFAQSLHLARSGPVYGWCVAICVVLFFGALGTIVFSANNIGVVAKERRRRRQATVALASDETYLFASINAKEAPGNVSSPVGSSSSDIVIEVNSPPSQPGPAVINGTPAAASPVSPGSVA